jgi:hypothetical protein
MRRLSEQGGKATGMETVEERPSGFVTLGDG